MLSVWLAWTAVTDRVFTRNTIDFAHIFCLASMSALNDLGRDCGVRVLDVQVLQVKMKLLICSAMNNLEKSANRVILRSLHLVVRLLLLPR